MISTNTRKLKPGAEPEKRRVLTTNNRTPQGFSYEPPNYPSVARQETRKVRGPMLSTSNLEERSRTLKREAARREIRALATAAKEPETKKAGRPKKT